MPPWTWIADAVTSRPACEAAAFATPAASARRSGAASAAHAAFEGLMAETVVGGLLLRVLEDFVGFADFLELRLSRLVARIGIRVELLGELAIGGLEFLFVGRFADAQNFVKIAVAENKTKALRGALKGDEAIPN